jgi:hypothetical protein
MYSTSFVTVLNFLEQFNILNENININQSACNLSKKDYSYNINIKQLLKKNVIVQLKNKVELKDCVYELSSNGHVISYYVPTGEAVQCSQGLKAGQIFESISSCKKLKIDLKDAVESKLFTDISFDYGGIDAIRKIDLVKKLKWNTWHVLADHLNDLVKDNFRMIIMSNSDPNNL